jgi:carbonic anhydrase
VTEIDEFKAANERYVADFDRGDLSMPPARGVAVVTCMDARLHPEEFLGSRWGRRM